MSKVDKLDLRGLERELGRAVMQATRDQSIQLSRDETNALVERLRELMDLRKLVFGSADVVGDLQTIEDAANMIEWQLGKKPLNEDVIARLLHWKVQTLVRTRKELLELRVEQRSIHAALDAIEIDHHTSELDDDLAEKHPTLALVERLRVSYGKMRDEIEEHESLWDSDLAREAASLRCSLEIIVENAIDEEWTPEDFVALLARLLNGTPAHESRTFVYELTAPFRERIRELESAVTKARECLPIETRLWKELHNVLVSGPKDPEGSERQLPVVFLTRAPRRKTPYQALDFDALGSACKRFLAIQREAQPGLATYHQAVHEAIRTLHEVLDPPDE